jgi:lipid-binding SYLF domain-containing protein
MNTLLAFALLVAADWPVLTFEVDPRAVETTVTTFEQRQPITKRLLRKAWGYVVFPSVTRGAFGVGGAYAEGGVYQRGKGLIGRTSLTALTLGLGAGAESYAEIIFFRDEAAFQRFAAGKLEFGARANLALLDQGVASEPPWADGVLVLALTKAGLMADASIGGQRFVFDPIDDDELVDERNDNGARGDDTHAPTQPTTDMRRSTTP